MAETRLDDLIRAAEADCDLIASQNDPAEYVGRPAQAIRLFYPRMREMEENEDSTYSNRYVGWNSLKLLQQLLLGIPLMVDAYDVEDLRDFKKVYGMTPGEFASQVKDGNIIPLINVRDPKQWSEKAVNLLEPVFETGKVQISSIRTERFQKWFTRGRLGEINDKAKDAFERYFSSLDPATEKKTYRTLRIHKYKDPGKEYPNVVKGRWRNILSVSPQLETVLDTVFSGLLGKPTHMKAQVLNGFNHLVSGSVTTGRGGLYRPGTQQVNEIINLKKFKALRPFLGENFISQVTSRYWANEAVEKFLEENALMLIPTTVNYDNYRRYVEHPFANTYRKKVADLKRALENLVLSAGVQTVNQARPIWEEIREESNRYRERFKRAEKCLKYLAPFVPFEVPIGDINMDIKDFVIELGFAYPGLFSSRKPIKRVACSLAQFVWKAKRQDWPPMT